MAGPGGGPPRRSHTKSRNGCETCKKRHIRCDENFPQCKNCTKHSVRCPYMDMPPQEERATPERPDLLWTPEIEAQIELWQQTGEFPFPALYIMPAPSPQFFSVEDLRLIHHVASISWDLSLHDAGNFTIWTSQIPLFLRIGTSYAFVMHALLALSASHIAWLTDCPLVNQMAIEHRVVAMQGLQEAIGLFSRENSDAVLAASLLLSWQATEWRSWTQLMHGTSSVIDAMQPWKNESQFGDFIAEQSTFPTAPPSPMPNAKKLTTPRKTDMEALQFAYGQLGHVETTLAACNEDTKAITQLMTFVRSIRKVSASHTAAQRFEMLNPLRAWLFWLPVMYMQQARESPYALVVLAYYYTVALVVEPIFPEVGAAYFGSLSLGPIEEIARRLFSVNVSQDLDDELQTPLALIEYPIDMVTKFRSRMGWVQPERTASFPTFETSFAMEQQSFYNHPSFSYSQEHLSPFNSEPASAISPLSLDPFGGNQYLGVPSPSPFTHPGSPSNHSYSGGGFHSPSSSLGDIAFSDMGGDEYMYSGGMGGDMPMAQGFGGTSPAHEYAGSSSDHRSPSPSSIHRFPLLSSPMQPVMPQSSDSPQYSPYDHDNAFLSSQSPHDQQQQQQQHQYLKFEPATSSAHAMQQHQEQQQHEQQYYAELERSSTVKGKGKEERHQQQQFYKLDRSSTVKGKEKASDK